MLFANPAAATRNFAAEDGLPVASEILRVTLLAPNQGPKSNLIPPPGIQSTRCPALAAKPNQDG